MSRIFISYKRADKAKVLKIRERIEETVGESCWMDMESIESDAQFASVIMKAIDDAEVMLFMYSKAHGEINNYDEDWTVRELNYAREKKKKRVFVCIDDTPFTDWFKFMFPYVQCVDARKEEDMERLVHDLRRWLDVHEPETTPNPIPKPKRRHVRLSLLLLLVAAVLLGVAYWLYDDGRARDPEFKDKSFTVNGVTFEMVAVEGGTFEQGSDLNREAYPAHSVTLSDYYIGRCEVTQELWDAVMGCNRCYFRGLQLPVECVTWDMCQEFIRKLNSLTGKTFRLPTEAEWEYAARGGSKSKGYKYSGSDDINSVAWYFANSGGTTHPVGGKKPNELGIYDMSGNVNEWCQDWWGYYSNSAQTNTQGPSSGSYRVLRGGGWGHSEDLSRVSFRDYYSPDLWDYKNGFRLALAP